MQVSSQLPRRAEPFTLRATANTPLLDPLGSSPLVGRRVASGFGSRLGVGDGLPPLWTLVHSCSVRSVILRRSPALSQRREKEAGRGLGRHVSSVMVLTGLSLLGTRPGPWLTAASPAGRLRGRGRAGGPDGEVLPGRGLQPELQQQLRAAPRRRLPHHPRPADLRPALARHPVRDVPAVAVVLVHGPGAAAAGNALRGAARAGTGGRGLRGSAPEQQRGLAGARGPSCAGHRREGVLPGRFRAVGAGWGRRADTAAGCEAGATLSARIRLGDPTPAASPQRATLLHSGPERGESCCGVAARFRSACPCGCPARPTSSCS